MNSLGTRLFLLGGLLGSWGAGTLEAGDEPGKEMTVEAFRIAVKEARSIDEKVDLIRVLGGTASPDTAAVVEISRFLAGHPADLNFQLPLAAASALANLRGNKAASQCLIQALTLYKKTYFVERRLLAALGQVGHESALPVLEDLIRGTDTELAMLAIAATADLPADLALDSLFRTADWMAARRVKVGDDVKKAHDRLGLEILRVVQLISAEKYPTLTEMQRWWQKHNREWKDVAAGREQDREKQKGATPILSIPGPILELLFNERGGQSTANRGSSSGQFPSALLTKARPVWSGEAPPPGGGVALDWGAEAGPYAVDVAGSLEHLRNLKSFTVTGWLNARSASEGAGGNRIVSWLDRDGVEILHRSDGSLQVGVNAKAEYSEGRTPPAQIPVADLKVDHALTFNWRFFAVTYDSTAAGTHLKIYIGTRDLDAVPMLQKDYPAGKVGSRIAAGLSVGNVPAALRQISPQCNFRGLIDEVRIFGSTRDGSGALPLAVLLKIQGRP
jgi:hypothetical protein